MVIIMVITTIVAFLTIIRHHCNNTINTLINTLSSFSSLSSAHHRFYRHHIWILKFWESRLSILCTFKHSIPRKTSVAVTGKTEKRGRWTFLPPHNIAQGGKGESPHFGPWNFLWQLEKSIQRWHLYNTVFVFTMVVILSLGFFLWQLFSSVYLLYIFGPRVILKNLIVNITFKLPDLPSLP